MWIILLWVILFLIFFSVGFASFMLCIEPGKYKYLPFVMVSIGFFYFVLSSIELPHYNKLLKPDRQEDLIEQINLGIFYGDEDAINCVNYYSNPQNLVSHDRNLKCYIWLNHVVKKYEWRWRGAYEETFLSSIEVPLPRHEDWEDPNVWKGIKGNLKPKPISEFDMKEGFDPLNLPEVQKYSPDEIKEMRLNFNLSQAVFATYLNSDVSTVKKWEQGSAMPNSAELKLLNLIQKKGINVLADE